LTEEVGEVAKGIQEKDITNLRYELIQVAAVAVRWIEAIDKSYPSLDNKQK
jgi:NTP pyrophosphatase (non-canonical NTP hydrolase)